ncbi:Carboxylesterase type B [Penicillium expansum]|nr:Carboxylesterase type B [Penicillium expansum]
MSANRMDAIFAKIAEETSKFQLGDEEIWRKLYDPFYPEPPQNVTVIRDERYGPSDRNLLDVFVPHGNDSNRPVMMYGRGSVEKVVLFGHSSGGAHIAMNLYAAGDPERASQSPVFPPVAGVMYLSVPFWYDRTKPVRQKTIRSYYGSDSEDVWGPKSALGLFQRLPDNSPLLDSQKIPVYLGSVEWEV